MSLSKKNTALIAGGAAAGSVVAWKYWKRVQARRRNRGLLGNQKIIILGAGFAGMNVAHELSRLLPREEDGQITLVDQNNFLLFTPMLTEVAGGELDPRHVVASPRRISPRVRFEQGVVEAIDLANKSITLKTGFDGHNGTRSLNADHLVLALGSVPSYHHIPGVREHSLSIKNVTEAAEIRNRVLACLELANAQQDGETRKQILTFVVAGGGYTGVETMAALNDLARDSAKKYPNIGLGDISTIIVESGGRLLAEITPDLAAFARRKLEERGVEVILNTKIASAGPDYVEVEGGKRIPARTLIWAGGVAPNPLVEKLGLQRSRHGAIVVDECCSVPGHPGLWATGDCAEVPKQGSKGTYAPTAQNATREGAVVARNIVAVLCGRKPQPFRYTPIGELALVGRHSGVAKIRGHQFSGFLAWAMWRAIYLSKMPGMAQRSRILVDWLLDAIFGREISAFPLSERAQRNPMSS
jgi:NADH:quinone reductase (non-electrogenic)